MTTAISSWLVGFRDGAVIESADINADSPLAAADTVRLRHPGCLVAAVIPLPPARRGIPEIAYSELPKQYRTMRRFETSIDSQEHGYVIVFIDDRGGRSITNRPLSRDDAIWLRDWMLRGYFQDVVRSRTETFFPMPRVPRVVQLLERG